MDFQNSLIFHREKHKFKKITELPKNEVRIFLNCLIFKLKLTLIHLIESNLKTNALQCSKPNNIKSKKHCC